MIFFKIIICILFSLNLFAAENYIDSITLTKVKKLIEKEEEIAIAYKKYLLKEGKIPDKVATLITDGYLPKGFDTINPFGKEIQFTTSTSYSTNDSLPEKVEIKTNLFDYYYSNKYRVYTKAPISVSNSKVEIILSSKEKFIYDNVSEITTIPPNTTKPTDKYYLDKNNVLHWYDSTGTYKFSIDKELIVDSSVKMLEANGDISDEFIDLIEDKNVTFAGQTILYNNITDGVASEYLYLGFNIGIVKVNSETRDIGKTVIQFTRRAGGMIVNGDIYTWGNNANKVTGIDIENYTGGTSSSRYPVITGLVRAKVKTYTDSIDNANYFSSPLRPKFVDFFSTVYHGTCGVSTKGELFCGGVTAEDKGSLYTALDTNGVSNPPEMFYRSNYFDGTTDKKATKIFANNGLWLMLGNTDIDANGDYINGKIYRWGYDYAGFAGNGSKYDNYNNNYNNYKTYNTYNNYGNPTELVVTENSTKVLFKDITYLLTIGYRKTAALSNDGDVFLWGLDTYSNYSCLQYISGWVNLCEPKKVDSSISFSSIQGGLNAFVAKGNDGKYYKISQSWGSLPKVELVNDKIKTMYTSQYIEADDSTLIWVDFTSTGIVWINSNNELKGDYFTSENKSDPVFIASIAKIKWKKIKVIEDDNGMCGIDIYNQMYCWGMQSFYRSGYASGNTFMIPVFNTNLYDLDKDYLVAEGGDNYLTNMTSTPWTTSDNKGPFFIKYPTYIGGFNYEFIFK